MEDGADSADREDHNQAYVEPPYWPTWQEGEAPTQAPPYPEGDLLDATPFVIEHLEHLKRAYIVPARRARNSRRWRDPVLGDRPGSSSRCAPYAQGSSTWTTRE